jgi:geranylgeranyl diphosphate synthase, type I
MRVLDLALNMAPAPANPVVTPPLTAAAEGILGRVEAGLAATLDAEARAWGIDDPDAAPVVETLERFVRSGGKRLRPRFCAWGHVAGGGASEDDHVVALGMAVELLHAFALIHDDVMDGSERRRGRPSVHAQFEKARAASDADGDASRYGESMAILTGDLAHTLAERLMLEQSVAVRREWHAMQVELTRGQALDLTAAARRDYTADSSRRIAILKSGRYTVVRPLTLGALTAARPDLVGPFADFGEPVGQAFQLRDDLLGAFGAEQTTGKPVGDDLREGKPTLLVAYARRRTSGAARALLDRIGCPDLDPSAIADIQDLLVTCGARDDVERAIDRLVANAFVALDRAPVEAEARTALRDLVAGAVWRCA